MLAAMAAAPHLLLLLPILLRLASPAGSVDDSTTLLTLKQSFANPSALSSWSSSTSPCNPRSPWTGVNCVQGIVTGLRLESLSLSGSIDVDALVKLPALRSLSFANNSFSGPIPPLNRLDALKALYLNRNNFSGPIPDSFFAKMNHLKKLYLANNHFSGPIPSSLSAVPTLIELHLEGNRFSGPIPQLKLPALSSLDLSKNALAGAIPVALGAKFDARSFSGNPALCGLPLADKPCSARATQASAAAALAAAAAAAAAAEPPPADSGHGNTMVLVGVIIATALLIVAVGSAKRRRQGEYQTLGVANVLTEVGDSKKETNNPAARKGSSRGGTQRSNRRSGSSLRGGEKASAGDLVMVNDEKGVFGMQDLMKAAAEVLGNGGLGSAYKAVMANGLAVAVKRARDMNRLGKETFDLELRRLGRLRHKNVLPPLAYHYRKEEKLLIYEYIPKGSLLYALHGNRGPDHEALDWPTRMKIILGIARGMAHLHGELTSVDIPHGNLKSGNVLLAADFEPLLIDYGYIPLVNPSQASTVMFAYKSPESLTHRHVCPKSDVYCLGILLLEVLTGKFPSQYLNNTKGGTDVIEWANSAINENRVSELLDPAMVADHRYAVPDMERLIEVSAACIEPDLDRRLGMKEACERIEEIAEHATNAITANASATSQAMHIDQSGGEHY